MVTAHLRHSVYKSEGSSSAAPATVTSNRFLELLLRLRSLRLVAWLYLICVLPTTIFLCFLIPPMQVSDEGRHFLRAYEFSRSQMLPDTGFSHGLFAWDSHGKPMPGVLYTTGGIVPVAVANFVRDKVTSADFLLREYHFPSIASRLRDLDAAAPPRTAIHRFPRFRSLRSHLVPAADRRYLIRSSYFRQNLHMVLRGTYC